MAATNDNWNKAKRMAGVAVAAVSVGLAAIVGPAAVANASPEVSVNGEKVTPAKPGNGKAPFTKVGSDPVKSVISGITGIAGVPGLSSAEIPPLINPWPGGAWAGKDLSKGWPGGAWAGHDWSKGWPGGGYANGKAGGAWFHSK